VEAVEQSDIRGSAAFGNIGSAQVDTVRSFPNREAAVVEIARQFKDAADRNDAEGQYDYESCLCSGSGVPIDLVSAAHYFELAADQDHGRAQYKYAVCLEGGHGVAVDLRPVAQYFKLAADHDPAQSSFGGSIHVGDQGHPLDMTP
jgi:TPR repeat protein